MIKKEELFLFGYFSKPHGIKGELSLHTHYDNLFDTMDEPYLDCEIDGIFVPFFIEMIRQKNDSKFLVKLEHINDDIAAKKLSNKTVYCPLVLVEDHPHEKQGLEFFIGFTLVGDTTGVLGEITDVDESTINALFKVNYQGRELLVPVVNDLLLSVDRKERKLVMTIPEGLIDL